MSDRASPAELFAVPLLQAAQPAPPGDPAACATPVARRRDFVPGAVAAAVGGSGRPDPAVPPDLGRQLAGTRRPARRLRIDFSPVRAAFVACGGDEAADGATRLPVAHQC